MKQEYRERIRAAIKQTEVEKEQKAFHLSNFFYPFMEMSISCQVSSECNSCDILEYMQRNLESLLFFFQTGRAAYKSADTVKCLGFI